MSYSIVLPATSSQVEQNAAAELQHYLELATGAEFPVVSEPHDGPGLFVGFTAFAEAHGIAAKGGINLLNGVEAWVVQAVAGNLVLTGGRDPMHRGILYAAYHYLEDVVGVRWWNPLEEFVPTLSEFTIDPEFSLAGEPKPVMRHAVSNADPGDQIRFMVRRRMSTADQRGIPAAWGGSVDGGPRGNSHTIDMILPRTEELFAAHPEWFAWRTDEKRRLPYGFYCLSNKDLQAAWERAFLDDIARIFAERDAAGEPRPFYFEISPDDTPFFCQCDGCAASMATSGASGYLLTFVNRMAAAAGERYPDILIETLAYWFYLEPPLDDTVPAKNVMVRLADSNVDVLHDKSHPANAHSLELLNAWAELCERGGNPFAIWDYNVAYHGTIAPNTLRTGPLLKMYDSFGVVGYLIEHEIPFSTDFWNVKYWLLTHLLEDPTLDQDTLVDDFLAGYYGAAAGPLREYLDFAHTVVQATDFRETFGAGATKADFVTWGYLLKANELFDRAAAAVEYDDVFSRRVRQARSTVDVALVTRHDTLQQEAHLRNEVFPIDRQVPALRYALSVQESKNLLLASDLTEAERDGYDEQFHYQNQLLPYPGLPGLPPQFTGYPPGDVLQIALYDTGVSLNYRRRGVEYVIDPQSVTGKAFRLNLAKMRHQSQRDALRITPRGTDVPPTMRAALRHQGPTRHEDPSFRRPFHLEDLTAANYALYKLFDIDRLSMTSDTMLALPGLGIHLSGFSAVLGERPVTVWLSMKVTGANFGGDPSDMDAVWYDRLFLIAAQPEPGA